VKARQLYPGELDAPTQAALLKQLRAERLQHYADLGWPAQDCEKQVRREMATVYHIRVEARLRAPRAPPAACGATE
jgi:hypothetical protein